MASSLRSVFRAVVYDGSKFGIFKQNHNALINSRHFCEAKIEAVADTLDSVGIEEQNQSAEVSNKKIRKTIPLETSLRYMESTAYKETYGDNLVWKEYRRNFKGAWAPKRTRKTCIRGGEMATGNPCPICRDEYLVLDYTNLKLLQQFLSPITGEVLETKTTGICRKKQEELEVAVIKAIDYGYLTCEVPHRLYNYEDYYPQK